MDFSRIKCKRISKQGIFIVYTYSPFSIFVSFIYKVYFMYAIYLFQKSVCVGTIDASTNV